LTLELETKTKQCAQMNSRIREVQPISNNENARKKKSNLRVRVLNQRRQISNSASVHDSMCQLFHEGDQ
jgi:hypothetical protein